MSEILEIPDLRVSSTEELQKLKADLKTMVSKSEELVDGFTSSTAKILWTAFINVLTNANNEMIESIDKIIDSRHEAGEG